MGKSRSRKRRAKSTQSGGGASSAEPLVLLKKPKLDDDEFFVDIDGCERTRSRVARKNAAKAVLGPEESSKPSSSSTTLKHPLSTSSKHSRTTKRRLASKKRSASKKKAADAIKTEPGSEGERSSSSSSSSSSIEIPPETVEELDIWSAAADNAVKKSLPKAALGKFTVELEPKKRKLRQSKRIAEHLRKHRSSNFTPMVPLPGASANPAPEDHQDALKAATDFLAAQSRSEDDAKRRLKEAVRRSKKLQQEAGDEDDEGDSEVEDSQDGASSSAPRPATKPDNRVTRAKKNKRARHRIELQAQRKRKLEKEARDKLHRLKHIASAVEVETKEHKEEVERREKERAEAAKKPTTGRFGKNKYQPVFPEVLLTEDLTDNLRSLKPSGDAFMDIQNALERRNLVEVRKKTRIRPRYKKKFYTMKQDTHWGRGGGTFLENQQAKKKLDKKLAKR